MQIPDPKTASIDQILAYIDSVSMLKEGKSYPISSGALEAWIGFLVNERDRLNYKLETYENNGSNLGSAG